MATVWFQTNMIVTDLIIDIIIALVSLSTNSLAVPSNIIKHNYLKNRCKKEFNCQETEDGPVICLEKAGEILELFIERILG